jgi:DNA-binding Lrp family transcriptional regulator
MITITKKENFILNQIKYLQAEYSEGVPYNILKLDSDLSETKLKDILNSLENNGLISKADNYIKALTVASKINIVESSAEVRQEELNREEENALIIIEELTDDDGLVSRHILEGNLLYGDLKLSNLGMYHLIIKLENKGLIKKINMKDGEYYKYKL